MTEYLSLSTEQTEDIATELAKSLKKGDFVAMYGDLGVGKTAFVRGLARVLAPNASVKSPTYTVVNEYKGDSCKLFHFDVYRIEDEDDLYSIGFDDYPDRGICLIEWSENIPFALPDEYVRVLIEKTPTDENERIITIERV